MRLCFHCLDLYNEVDNSDSPNGEYCWHDTLADHPANDYLGYSIEEAILIGATVGSF